jgi:hypothetical protein
MSWTERIFFRFFTDCFRRFRVVRVQKWEVYSTLFNLLIAKDIEEAIEEIADSDPKGQDRRPVLFEERKPFVAMRQTFVFDKLSKEHIAPDGAQSEGDWIKNKPEDDLFCFYLRPVFLFGECDDKFNMKAFGNQKSNRG